MKNKLVVLFILLLTLLLSCGAVSAADAPVNTQKIVDSSGDHVSDLTTAYNVVENSSINQTKNLQTSATKLVSPSPNNSYKSISKNIIKGNVKQCSNGDPFAGVTVTVKTLKGKLLARTLTDGNGNYQVTFTSNDTYFDVTASHNGHGIVTKTVTLNQNRNGIADFRLAPQPVVSFNPATSNIFIGSDFNFNLDFDNTSPTDTGYNPIIELILSPEITFNGASFLGINVRSSYVGIFDSTGLNLRDPLTNQIVNGVGLTGYQLYVLEYPLGSFTPDQPVASMVVDATLSTTAPIAPPATSIKMYANPIFRFGDNPAGGTPIHGTRVEGDVYPTVITLDKTSNAPEDETATGENYPIRYTLSVDVANPATINNVVVTDVIPDNLHFVRIIDDAGGIASYDINTRTLTVIFTSILGSELPKNIIYEVYAPDIKDAGGEVISHNTGASVPATNIAIVTGDYGTLTVSDSDSYTLTLRSLAIQKGVTVSGTGSYHPKPDDTLHYTLNFQLSDYFAMKYFNITDIMADGQTFQNINPTLTMNLPGIVAPITLTFDRTNPAELEIISHPDGSTTLIFHVSQLLYNHGYLASLDSLIEGGLYGTNLDPATQGTIQFWSIIDRTFYDGQPIVSRDIIGNTVTAAAQLPNNAGISDGSASSVEIIAPWAQKSIYAITRDGVVHYDITNPQSVMPGDIITFLIQISVPTTNLDNFYFVDYLPIPFLDAVALTGEAPGNTPPAAGHYRLASGMTNPADDDTLTANTGVLPTVTANSSENTITFTYGNISNLAQPFSLVSILFSLTAQNRPMADALNLANLLTVYYNNNFPTTYSTSEVVNMLVRQPALKKPTKTVNPTAGDAGDDVTYTITLENDGGANAYNVHISDVFPLELVNIRNIQVTYGDGTPLLYSVSINPGSMDIRLDNPSYPIGPKSDDPLNPNPKSVVYITYIATIGSTVYPRQRLTNTVTIESYTSTPDPTGPNYIINRLDYQDEATVTVTSPEIDKSVTPITQTIGDKGTVNINVRIPEGQTNNLEVTDTLPLGINYMGNVNVIPGVGIILGTLTTTTGTLPDGRQWVKFIWDSVTVTPSVSTVLHTLSISFDTRVVDDLVNNPRGPPYTISKTNTVSLDWDNNPGPTVDNTSNFNVVQPHLLIDKSVSPTTANAGQTVTYTITVDNDGASNAYNFSMVDVLSGTPGPSVFFDLNSFTAVLTPAGFSYTYNPLTGVLTYTANSGVSIAPSDPLLTFRFSLTLRTDAPSGSNFRNTATATYASLESGGRSYTDSDYAVLSTTAPTLIKSIIAHSEPYTSTVTRALIGEVLTYQLTFSVPRGITTNAVVTDGLRPSTSYGDLAYIANSWTYNIPANVIAVNTPPIFTYDSVNRILTFDFGTITNNNAGSALITLTFKAVVMNTATNQRGTNLRNRARLSYQNASGTTLYTTYSNVDTYVLAPVLAVTKTPSTTTAQGGDTITFTVTITNQDPTPTGYSGPAYNIHVVDNLNSNYENLQLVSITPGYTYTDNSSPTQLNIDIDTNHASPTPLNPGASIVIVYTARVKSDVVYGTTIPNLVTVTGNSIPLPNGSGTPGETPGAPGSSTGARTGDSSQGSQNNIMATNSASVTITAPTITKAATPIIQTIGGLVTYTINVALPVGRTDRLRVLDVLPGTIANPQMALVSWSVESIPAGVTAQYYPPLFTQTGNTLEFNYGDVEASQPATLIIHYVVRVLNMAANTRGTVLNNQATVGYLNSAGIEVVSTPQISPVTVIEPNLSISKSVNPNTNLDGGDRVQITFTVTNTGSNTSPAYNVVVSDAVDPLLFDPTSWAWVGTPPTGFTLQNIGNTITITANDNTVVIPVGTTTFTISLKLKDNVPTASTFQNSASIRGYSLPEGTPERREYNPAPTAPVTITTRAPTATKTTYATSEHNPIDSNVYIGEVVTYRLDINVPEGQTRNVSWQDIISDRLGLILNSVKAGSIQIMRSSDRITVTGADFTALNSAAPGVFIDVDPSAISPLTFNLGDVLFSEDSTGHPDGVITIIFKAVVKNIAMNTRGDDITNQATLGYDYLVNSVLNHQTLSRSSSSVNILIPNITSTKGANPTTGQGGDTIHFTVTVSNDNDPNGAPAYDLVIYDPLTYYENLRNVMVNGVPYTVITPYLEVIIPILNKGQTVSITFDADLINGLTYGSQYINQVLVTGTTLPGLHGTNDATPGDPGTETGERTGAGTGVNDIRHVSSTYVTTLEPTIDKRVEGVETVNRAIGHTATETIMVNLPEGTTNHLLVTLVVPEGLQFSNFGYIFSTGISTGDPTVTQVGNVFYFDFGPRTATQAGTITITYTALVLNNINVHNGDDLTNTATLFYRNSSGTDVNAGSDTATIHVTEPDLQIIKTGDNNLRPGEICNFTLNVSHTAQSTADAYDLQILDMIPVGMTYVSGSAVAPGWTLTVLPNALVFTMNRLNLGSTSTITFQYRITSDPSIVGSDIINVADMTYATDSPSNPNRRTYNTNDDWTVHVIDALANLSITKDDNPDPVIAGEILTYTIRVTNSGPSDALNVIISDDVSAFLSGVTYTTSDGRTGTWDNTPFSWGTIQAGETVWITLEGTVISSITSTIHNVAGVTSPTDPDAQPGNPKTATCETQVNTRTNLNVEKTAPATVIAGDVTDMTFTIRIWNNGPSDAQNVILSDSVDLTRLSDVNYSWIGGSGPWTGSLPIGTVAAGSEVFVYITAHVLANAQGFVDNTATITTTTPNTGDESDDSTTRIISDSTLALIKGHNPNLSVIAGEELHYVLLLINIGPSVARNVVITDEQISTWLINRSYRYTLDLVNWSNWVEFTGSLNFDVSSVLPGGYLDLTQLFFMEINTTVDPATPKDTVLENWAKVTWDSHPEGSISNTVENTVDTLADLELTKSVEPQGTVIAGRNLIYTLNLTNHGPSVARNVIFTDNQLSSYLINRYYRYRLNSGTWSAWMPFVNDLIFNASNVLPGGYLAVDDIFQVQINATVNSSTPKDTTITNHATVTSDTSPGSVISNTVENQVNTLASLVITKVADVEEIVRGHLIHYTITITNNGPSDALNVNFYDNYSPKILERTYYSTSTGIPWTLYTSPLSITNIISRLAPGSSVTVLINGTVMANATRNLTNTAWTESVTDPTGRKTATVTTPLNRAHVTVKKTVSNPQPYIHEIIYFTLIVQNWGPDTAIDVYVLDKLPAGLKYISSQANYGTYNPTTGYWVIGNLPMNTIARLIMTVGVEKVGPIENHAHVSTASWDPILGPDSVVIVNAQEEPKPRPVPDPVNGKKVSMQKTGAPLPLLALALVMMLAGLLIPRRKK